MYVYFFLQNIDHHNGVQHLPHQAAVEVVGVEREASSWDFCFVFIFFYNFNFIIRLVRHLPHEAAVEAVEAERDYFIILFYNIF